MSIQYDRGRRGEEGEKEKEQLEVRYCIREER
jgi:hypothetical protein